MNIVSRDQLLLPGYSKEDFSIKNFKITPDGSQGQVSIKGELTTWIVYSDSTEVKSSDMLEEVWEEYQSMYEDMSVENPDAIDSFGEELDNSLEQANADAFYKSDIDILIKNGYSKGTIFHRKSDISEPYKYGIFTGEFIKDEFGTLMLKFTDHTTTPYNECELITDVNKYVFRYIADEQVRMKEELDSFIELTNVNIQNIIFG